MAVGDCSLNPSHHVEDSGRIVNVSVVWRGNRYVVEMDSGSCLKDLGDELRKLSGVKMETLRLIVPRLNEKGSKLLFPFSDEHSGLSLQEASIPEGKPIRMMGVSEDEVDRVLKDAKTDMRILGFEEEERRLRQKMLYAPGTSVKLPQGPYIFCNFRTLEIPGIELNPAPSESLKRMHRLAADPGIVAIMNKHRWRVGIMTELAPVGYVGVSPKCILGFNKNQGEEISLRLRTDDLKGFRKYERIKKTLLHELAHMVYSEHDENFYALDKQLNLEANSLDWTKSRGHTLSGAKNTDDFEEEYYFSESKSFYQKLGGNQSDQLEDARASSVAAAYRRLSCTTADEVRSPEVLEEPDPDDSVDICDETGRPNYAKAQGTEMDSDYQPDSLDKLVPDPDDSAENCKSAPYPSPSVVPSMSRAASRPEMMKILDNSTVPNHKDDEPDPDDNLEKEANDQKDENMRRSSGFVIADATLQRFHDITERETSDVLFQNDMRYRRSNPQDNGNQTMQTKPDPKNAEPDGDDNPVLSTSIEVDEPDPDDEVIHRIQDSVTIITSRLKKAIDVLHAEVNPTEATNVLQTLLRVVRNAIEHPGEMKFRRLRKGNPAIQRNILNYAAAVEILSLVGFVEDMVFEGTGQREAYLVLKRNDPGLLWLAKSFLDARIT